MSRFKKAQPIKCNTVSIESKFKVADRIISIKNNTPYTSYMSACHDAMTAIYSNSTLKGIMDDIFKYCENAVKAMDDTNWNAMATHYLECMERIKQIINEEIKEVKE